VSRSAIAATSRPRPRSRSRPPDRRPGAAGVAGDAPAARSRTPPGRRCRGPRRRGRGAGFGTASRRHRRRRSGPAVAPRHRAGEHHVPRRRDAASRCSACGPGRR
jgi:hypothetical protein